MGTHTIIRAAAIYLVVVPTLALARWRRPSTRATAGAFLAFCWNLPIVAALHVAGLRFGWWQFDAQGGVVGGIPVDMFLAWTMLWSVIPALAFGAIPPLAGGLLIGLADVVLMPLASPVLQLGPRWMLGELLGTSVGVVPGLYLARWTTRDIELNKRALLQVVAFSLLLGFLLPTVIIAAAGNGWTPPWTRPTWQWSLAVQVLTVPAILGLSAVQEFVTRGGGTPFPYDPPKQMVSTGPYAYVRNPMQLSAAVMMLLLGVVLASPFVAAGGVMAHIYAEGIAGWNEQEDLRQRFGGAWSRYRQSVGGWIPRWRPLVLPDAAPARLYVSHSCNMCREVAAWFRVRHAQGLEIVPAEAHRSAALIRVTYESGDGSYTASGIEALARGLEHIHFGWAMVSFAARLPGVLNAIQLLADASGAGPRTIPSLAAGSTTCTPQPGDEPMAPCGSTSSVVSR